MRETLRRFVTYVCLFLLGSGWSACFGVRFGSPVPVVHDANAYVLAGDTFSRGRLTNPTPDGWEHFETFHVLLRPTYMAKYPPGQGLILALGRVLTGSFLVGVWISVGLMVASFYYLLTSRLPPSWAWGGAGIAALLLGGPGYWAQSHWGGAVGAFGGGLWFGAVLRTDRNTTLKNAFVAGVGAAILSLSRPLEGLFAVAVSMGWLLVRLSRRHTARRDLVVLLLGIGVPVAVTLAWQGYYNYRITTDAFESPYGHYEREYALAPNLLPLPGFEESRTYRHDVIQQYHEEWGSQRRENLRKPRLFLLSRAVMLGWGAVLFAGPFLLLLLQLRRSEVRAQLSGTGPPLVTVTALVGLSMGAYPHYLAPVAGLYLLTAVTCLRSALESRRRMFEHALAVFCIVLFFVQVTDSAIRRPQMRTPDWVRAKLEIASRLEGAGDGRHLVFVQYGADHNVHREWVYNGAEFDEEPILWARSIDPRADARLIGLYASRTPWVLDLPSDDKPRLQPLRLDDRSGDLVAGLEGARAAAIVQGSCDSMQTERADAP